MCLIVVELQGSRGLLEIDSWSSQYATEGRQSLQGQGPGSSCIHLIPIAPNTLLTAFP